MAKTTYAFAAVALAMLPGTGTAQTRTSDQIAREWREVKQRELVAKRDALALEIEALREATPPIVADTPASAATATTVTTPAPAPAPATATTAVASVAAALPATPPPPAPPTAEAIAKAIKALDKKPGGTFGGIDFGGGISFTLDIGTSDRISEASVVDNIVRVNDENNGRARIMLESHYLFTPSGRLSWLGLENVGDDNQWGWGPFIALQPGTDDVIEAVGMGIMFGARRGAGDDSFNLGFGVVVDPNTRILGEGLTANAALPPGETGVRYKEEMQTGLLILSSFSF